VSLVHDATLTNKRMHIEDYIIGAQDFVCFHFMNKSSTAMESTGGKLE